MGENEPVFRPIFGNTALIRAQRIQKVEKVQCKLCNAFFRSKLEVVQHQKTHKDCPKCHLHFKSAKERANHEQFCTRRFGLRINRPARPASSLHPPTPEKKKVKHKCILCKKPCTSQEGLRRHHKKCSARRVSKSWCLKLWKLPISISTVFYKSDSESFR